MKPKPKRVCPSSYSYPRRRRLTGQQSKKVQPEPESDDVSDLTEEEVKPAKSKPKPGAKRGKAVKEEEEDVKVTYPSQRVTRRLILQPASKKAKPDSKTKKPASSKKGKKAPVDEDEDSE